MSRILAVLALVCLAACAPQQQARRPLVVLAAASLQEALTAEADAWAMQGHPRPTLSFAASSALARQVESGAPADLLVSADEEWMDLLEKAGSLRPGTRRDLLSNAIVLIAPRSSAAKVELSNPATLAAALDNGKLAMADPEAVPAGKYGKAALEHMGAWQSVSGRIATAENVRAALRLVESGEAPLGIVYATDAAADANVRIVGTFPESTHPPIVYPAALTENAASPDAAAFLAYLRSPAATPLFEKQGFTVLK